MKRLLTPALALVLLMTISCASVRIDTISEIVIKPLETFEKCFEMSPGEELAYSFQSSSSVNFDVKVHRGDKVFNPVSKKKIFAYQDVLNPSRKRNYCLVWENHNHFPVTITGIFKK